MHKIWGVMAQIIRHNFLWQSHTIMTEECPFDLIKSNDVINIVNVNKSTNCVFCSLFSIISFIWTIMTEACLFDESNQIMLL